MEKSFSEFVERFNGAGTPLVASMKDAGSAISVSADRLSSAQTAIGDHARAIEQVAASLGNTPTVCRKCYIHPAVLDAFEAGVTAPAALTGKHLQPYKALRQPERRAVALLLHWQRTASRRDLAAQLAGSLTARKAA